jgi:ADP-L-glycero-D-manno-heptose 6-epimerase
MIVVTGAAGFIGSNILRGLNDAGVTDILAVDDLTNGAAARNLAGKQFVDYLDWHDFVASAGNLPQLSAVLHFGANTNTRETDGRLLVDVNYNASKTALSVAARYSCALVYASSAGVYGRGPECKEEFACEQPESPYAVSKWLFDQYVRQYLGSQPQHPVCGLRLFNVYGPGEAHKGAMASVAYQTFEAARLGVAQPLFPGSDAIKRDFVFVQDVVDVVMYMLTANKSGIFNVGTGHAESFTRMATLASELSGGPLPEEAPTLERPAWYQAFTQADLTALRAAGYEDKFTSLEDGLRAYWKSYISTL